MQKNLVIVIGGSTGSGKSSLAMDLAIELDGIIINADSMQVYKDTPIISACPSFEDKQKIPHFLYEIFESNHHGNVWEWIKLATFEIKKAWEQNKIPIIVGGTGMYIDSLINGMSPIPQTSSKTKEYVANIFQNQGIKKAYELLQEVDEKTAEKTAENDTTRIRRALEVFYDTKTPISTWHKTENVKPLPQANFFKIKITPPAEEVDQKCYQRFDKMIEDGAIFEAQNIKQKNLNPEFPAMKALGIVELIDFLDDKISLKEALDLSKIRTRQYAKRQRTWFNNKFNANIDISHCYKTSKNIIENIKKLLHKTI